MNHRLALFDLDGTLVDSQGHIVTAMRAAFADVGRAAPERIMILSQVGLSLPVVMNALAGDATDEERTRMLSVYKSVYQRERAKAPVPLFRGIRAILDDLVARDDVLIGIATGASRRGMEAVLGSHDVEPATAQCADDHPSKPDPSMVFAALAEAGVAKDDAIMIGDTTYDMEMARAAGISALGVGWGYHAAGALLAAGAEQVLACPDGLAEILDGYWGVRHG